MFKMAEYGQNERASFGKIARNQTRYGTNTKAIITNETFVKHYVKPGETLQGIALKYGSTMEQIKRANNIWTNDSLFLREFLLVPLNRSPLQEAPSSLPNGRPADSVIGGDNSMQPVGDAEIVTRQDLLQGAGRTARSGCSRSGMPTSRSESECLTPEPSPRDYLSKFDTSLAQIRSSVQELDKASNFTLDEDNPLSLLPIRRTSRYGNRQKSRSFDVTFGADDPSVEPGLVFKSQARSKRAVQGSLERLEKTADDIFQL